MSRSTSTMDGERTPLLPPALAHETLQAQLYDSKVTHNIDDDVLPETATVGRTLGWSSAYILVISRVIGSGIFAMPGSVIQTVGSPGAALVLWVVGAVLAWISLAIDMEFGCMLPRSGGMKVYLEYTYRWPKFLASVMVATHAILLGFTAANCIVFAKYTIFALQLTPGDVSTKVLAVGLLTVIVVVHGCFYRTGILIQNILGWVKVALIAFMIVTGLFVVMLRNEEDSEKILARSAASSEWWQDMWTDTDWAWNNISTSFFKVLYSYAGLSNINNVLNEVKNPVRTVKTVGPAALWTACGMYLLINVAYLQVVPLQDIKQSRELIAALFFERVFGPSIGGVVLPLFIAISAAGNVMVVVFSLARLKQEIARQGFLPFASFVASSKPFGAPLGALIVHYIPSVLVIACPPSSTVYSFLADVEAYAGQFFTIAIAGGLLLLRVRQPDLRRPFKAWTFAVWLPIILSSALILAPLFPSVTGHADVDFWYASYALVALSVLMFGVLYWFVWMKVLPKLCGFEYVDEVKVLDDGTVIKTLAKKARQCP